MEWCKTLKKSFIFAVNARRWLPVFAADTIFASLLISSLVLASTIASANISNLITFLIGAFMVLCAYSLAKIWINGAIVYQSYREGDKVKKSFKVSYSKYLSLLGATIIVGIINMIANMIPWIGFIFGIVVSLMFFFIYQGIIINGLKFDSTLEHSYNIFKKNWGSVLGIFIVLLVTTGLIALAFSIPLILLFFYWWGSYGSIESVVSAIASNLIPLAITGIFMAIGFSIAQVFNTKAQTEFYLQLTKTKAVLSSTKKSIKTAKNPSKK